MCRECWLGSMTICQSKHFTWWGGLRRWHRRLRKWPRIWLRKHLRKSLLLLYTQPLNVYNDDEEEKVCKWAWFAHWFAEHHNKQSRGDRRWFSKWLQALCVYPIFLEYFVATFDVMWVMSVPINDAYLCPVLILCLFMATLPWTALNTLHQTAHCITDHIGICPLFFILKLSTHHVHVFAFTDEIIFCNLLKETVCECLVVDHLSSVLQIWTVLMLSSSTLSKPSILYSCWFITSWFASLALKHSWTDANGLSFTCSSSPFPWLWLLWGSRIDVEIRWHFTGRNFGWCWWQSLPSSAVFGLSLEAQ